jgi:hypothetical protein
VEPAAGGPLSDGLRPPAGYLALSVAFCVLYFVAATLCSPADAAADFPRSHDGFIRRDHAYQSVYLRSLFPFLAWTRPQLTQYRGFAWLCGISF